MVAKKRKFRAKRSRQLYALCIIPMLLVFIFSYLPMFGIVIAFKNYKYNLGIWGSKWVGLENFQVFMMSDDFTRITYNTVVLNLLFLIVGMICAVLLAVVLFEIRSRRTVKACQTVLITPHFLSWVVAGYMVYAFLAPEYGFVTNILQKVTGSEVNFYTNPEIWPLLLCIIHVWKHIGMNSVVYYASLMGVDSSLFEAARIDGANKVQEVRHIMIPQLGPVIVILFILGIGNIFRADFGLFYQCTRDVSALYRTTDVMDTYIFRTMRVLGDMQISSAAGLLQSVVGFILVIATNLIVKKIDPDRALF